MSNDNFFIFEESAEKKFKKFIKSKKIKAVRGLPDFMIIKNNEVVGFVEVKRDDLNDNLREDQRLFMKFCKKHNIPYQVWSPIMAGERFKNSKNKEFKKRMQYTDTEKNIWEMI